MMATTQRNKQDRIVRIPGVAGGKPIIKGTRIPVNLILERLTYNLDLKPLFEDYPDLTEEDIKACIAYVQELVEDEEPASSFFSCQSKECTCPKNTTTKSRLTQHESPI